MIRAYALNFPRLRFPFSLSEARGRLLVENNTSLGTYTAEIPSSHLSGFAKLMVLVQVFLVRRIYRERHMIRTIALSLLGL